jgi:hypothetical protein
MRLTSGCPRLTAMTEPRLGRIVLLEYQPETSR